MVPIVRGDEAPPADYKQKLHEATVAVMQKQLDAGLHEINDGELSRKDYVSEARKRMAGFGGLGQAAPAADLVEMKDFSKKLEGRKGLLTLTEKTEVKTASCDGPITYTAEGLADLQEEMDRVKAAAQEIGIPLTRVFFTSPSPGTLATFFSNGYYETHEKFIEALANAMKTEYHAISAAGFKLQCDCPDLGMGRHTRFSKCTIPEFREAAKCHVKNMNAALAGLDPARVRMHVCWGNYPGPHHHDIPLADIADIVVQAFPKYISVEACNPGHAHEHEVWAHFKVPQSKVFMPGVVDTTTSHIEHPRLVAQRLEAYARTFGTDRVISCTDCGFGTAAGALNLTEDIVWQKMKTMVTGAKSVGKKAEKASVCWMLYDQPEKIVGA
jgi:5-methyltetrahydropteroyltriglutamate--homocysteine methyltransferase